MIIVLRADISPNSAEAARVVRVATQYPDDRGLLELLARRGEVARAISQRKASLGRAVRDAAREASAFAERRCWAEAGGLDPAFVEQIFEAILHWSRSLQERVRGERGEAET